MALSQGFSNTILYQLPAFVFGQVAYTPLQIIQSDRNLEEKKNVCHEGL